MTTPCYYCEEDADVACRACIHSSTGPEIEQVIAWRAAPPPAADAVTPSPLVIRYNDDGEFGQRTGWLYREGGEPCAISGKPVYVWRPLRDLIGVELPRPRPERDCDSNEQRLLCRGWNEAIDAIAAALSARGRP